MPSYAPADSLAKSLAFTGPTSRSASPTPRPAIGAGKPAHPSKLSKGWTSDDISSSIESSSSTSVSVIDLTGCDQLEQEVGLVSNTSASHATGLSVGQFGLYNPQSKTPWDLLLHDEPRIYPIWNEVSTASNLHGGDDVCNLIERSPASVSRHDSYTCGSSRDIEEAGVINFSLPVATLVEIPLLQEDNSLYSSACAVGSPSQPSSQALGWVSEAPFVASPASGSSINTPDSGYLSTMNGTPSCSSPDTPYIQPEIFPEGWEAVPLEPLRFRAATRSAVNRRGSGWHQSLPRMRVSQSEKGVLNQSNQQKSMVPSLELADVSAAESASECDVVNIQPIPSIEQATTYQTSSASLRMTEAAPRTSEDTAAMEDTGFKYEEESPSSRDPTPWPESWYEGGMEFGLTQFAARIMAEYQDSRTCKSHILHQQQEIYMITSSGSTESAGQEPTQNQPDAVINQASQLPLPLSNLSKKRPKSDGTGGDEPDEDSSDPKRRRVMGPPEESSNRGPFYACPIQKRYPMDSPFCGMPHGSRRGYGWTTISRVKQHLLESHGRDHHCSNCWKAYKKVDDARNCHRKKNCLKRSSPPKVWLSETEAAHLRGERFPSRSDDAWYRIFGLLFPDKQEHGPDGYRAKYTPYYSKVEYPLPAQFPTFTNGTSPNSMWTPSSNSTQSTSLTPPDTNGGNNLTSGRDTQDDSQIANGSFSQLFTEEGAALFGMAQGLNLSTSQASNPETVSGSHMPNGDDSFSILGIDQGNYQAPVQNELLRPSSGLESSCCCSFARKCATCRLKQRNSDLRVENGTLRAAIESIRAALDRHDEFLQDIDDQKLLSDEIMAKLWCYQENTRTFLSSHK